MKWSTPIWSDPIGWSEKVAKTKFRVFIFVLFHIIFVLAGFCGIYLLLQRHEFQFDRTLTILALLGGAFPIFVVGIFNPALYLYAMHRLMRIIKEK